MHLGRVDTLQWSNEVSDFEESLRLLDELDEAEQKEPLALVYRGWALHRLDREEESLAVLLAAMADLRCRGKVAILAHLRLAHVRKWFEGPVAAEEVLEKARSLEDYEAFPELHPHFDLLEARLLTPDDPRLFDLAHRAYAAFIALDDFPRALWCVSFLQWDEQAYRGWSEQNLEHLVDDFNRWRLDKASALGSKTLWELCVEVCVCRAAAGQLDLGLILFRGYMVELSPGVDEVKAGIAQMLGCATVPPLEGVAVLEKHLLGFDEGVIISLHNVMAEILVDSGDRQSVEAHCDEVFESSADLIHYTGHTDFEGEVHMLGDNKSAIRPDAWLELGL